MTNRPNRAKVKGWPVYIKTFRAKHGLSQVRLAKLLNNIEERPYNGGEAGDYNPAPYLIRALRDLERELTSKHSPI